MGKEDLTRQIFNYMAHVIQLSSLGQNLSSRLMARKLMAECDGVIKRKETIILDFDSVRFMSLSFATEVVSTLYEKFHVDQVVYHNATEMIAAQIDFSIKEKDRELTHA